MDGRFISYLRVSTDRQGQSGLGISAQRKAVADYLNGGDWRLIEEYIEIESGKRDDRPQLAKALEHCRLINATLIVAKVDRLARNLRFLLNVLHDSGQGGVVFADLPHVPPGPAGKLIIQQMAMIAEFEAGVISVRTKAALAQSKKRLGGYRGGPVPDSKLASKARTEAADAFARRVRPIIERERAVGQSLAAVAAKLEEMGVQTRRGGEWSATAVRNVLAR